MSTSEKEKNENGYHHGNLREALIDAAVAMIEGGENFSLRGVARRAGVSQSAPYRHFADKDQLESAVAGRGFRELEKQLFAQGEALKTTEDVIAMASAYVDFALDHPRMYRLMFGTQCDDRDDERVKAATLLREQLAQSVSGLDAEADDDALALALWSTAHGLASLHLDGKFPMEPREQVHSRVHLVFTAIL